MEMILENLAVTKEQPLHGQSLGCLTFSCHSAAAGKIGSSALLNCILAPVSNNSVANDASKALLDVEEF